MSKIIYKLQIKSSSIEKTEKLSNLLSIKESKISGFSWILEKVDDFKGEYFDIIDYYIKILIKNSNLFKSSEFNNTEITLWILYEYKNQCNLEFSSVDLKKISDLGIHLCISCWEEQSKSPLAQI